MLKQSQIFWKIIILMLALAAGDFVQAADNSYFINLDKSVLSQGYTVSAFDGAVKLSLASSTLNEATGVEMLELNEIANDPWQLERISKIYQFEFKNKAAYDKTKPFYVQLSYDRQSDYYKQIFYYDKNYSAWRPLPTADYPVKLFARASIRLPFARVAVFANPEALVRGEASWYKHQGGMFAASPDFPKGSKLRVFNLDNNKFVDVVVNDFGPNRELHPRRVIDLDKAAFKKIAPLAAGMIKVRVEPLSIAKENNKVLGLAEAGVKPELKTTAKSAVVMDEQTGQILWQKNSTSTLPLASLSKLVAIKVFLDTRPTLNRPVVYSLKDEEHNYEYAAKSESARLKLAGGDVLTVEDLLYAALVGSANNAVETLVRTSGLARDEFILKMNQTVADWGATATHFIEPTGLAPENVSSALDYAIITKEVYTNPIIQKASVMRRYKFFTINTKKAHIIKNTDKLLVASRLNITGSKTGYLNEAQYCLMARAKDNSGRQVIAVTMGVPERQASFNETEQLLKYGLRIMSYDQTVKHHQNLSAGYYGALSGKFAY